MAGYKLTPLHFTCGLGTCALHFIFAHDHEDFELAFGCKNSSVVHPSLFSFFYFYFFWSFRHSAYHI